MAHPLTLPTVAVLSLVGAGIGIHLGKSSIAEINPAYFSGRDGASKFYADMTPHAPRNWAAVQAAELSAAEAGKTLHGCVGCRTYPEEYYPVHEASLTKPTTGWAEASEARAYAPDAAVMTPAEPPQFAQVARYTSYPMTAEEAEEVASADGSDVDQAPVGAAE